ncbi:MAG: GNAT family N-acetyltransferase [Bdellovibrionales bacterium]|nr:GNAT family N-acetyltransferase [Bdellovibrionales bacterium]
MEVQISEMKDSDCEGVARLSGQLGYPATALEISANWKVISQEKSHGVLVARLGDEVVGWLHLQEHWSLPTGARCEPLGLVIDENHRGKKIGTHLLKAAEDWARARGLPEIRFASQTKRTDAHRLYERLGYTITKTSHFFKKALT